MNNRKNGFFALAALLALASALQAQSQPDVTKPVIIRAGVNVTTGQLVIQGSHLKPASGPPTVQIDGGTLSLVSYEAGQIIAAFPEDLYNIGGSFLLKVIAGGTGTFDLAVGTTGLQGPQGPPGANGATGPAGPQGPPSTLALPFSGASADEFIPSIGLYNSLGDAIDTLGGGTGAGIYAHGGNQGGAGVLGYGGTSNTANEAGSGVIGFGAGAVSNGTLSGAGGSFTGGGQPYDQRGGGDGIDTQPGSDGGVGIYARSGQNSNGAVGTYAGVFNGDLRVDGNLAKAGGSFQIDHPLDPANKYLYHSFVESPDMKNVYDGTATTDAAGNATVALPDWFETLNRDSRYQLTTIGQLCHATVSTEISHNTFAIKTDKPNVKVSWQVTGIRQDAWSNAHRIPLEEEKAQADKGHYLHPELFEHAGEPSIAQLHHPMPKRPQFPHQP